MGPAPGFVAQPQQQVLLNLSQPQQQPQHQPQQQQQPPQSQPEMVKPVETPQVEPEPEKHNEAPSKPPGYASIAAGQKENNGSGNGIKNDEGRSKDEMPTIDDWNAEIAKDEEESDSNRNCPEIIATLMQDCW